jgi:hypothetical protein
VLRAARAPTFEKQVRDELAVHNRAARRAHAGSTRITQVSAGGFATAWCRAASAESAGGDDQHLARADEAGIGDAVRALEHLDGRPEADRDPGQRVARPTR